MIIHTPYRQQHVQIAPFVTTSKAGGWQALLAHNGFSLIGGLCLITFAQAMFIGFSVGKSRWFTTFQSASAEADLIAAIIATAMGHAYLFRVASLPLYPLRAYTFPAFFLTFSSVTIALFVCRIPFGFNSLGLSFILAVAWYFGIATAQSRFLKRRLAFIGKELPDHATAPDGIEWFLLKEPILTEAVSAIVVSRNADLTPDWEHFIGQAVIFGVPVHDSRHIAEIVTGRVTLHHLMENAFGSLLPSLGYVHLKHLIDFLAACVALIVALPVIIIFALLIRIESPGPAIFRQQRIGFRGEPFTCYKLRTMRFEHDGPHFTTAQDKRITRLGNYIRRYRIDELPQILNILKGEMSWIGPRPEMVQLALVYDAAIPFYLYRHAVRPGITGWAAVNQGNVGEVDAAIIKLQYDFFYIKYFSLWLDLLIALKTIRTVMTGFGSK